jgi:hypothetical protein
MLAEELQNTLFKHAGLPCVEVGADLDLFAYKGF